MDNIEGNGLVKHLQQLKYRWLSCARINEIGEALCYQQLHEDGWHSVEPESISQGSPFSKVVLLIADQKCSFRCLEFPVDMVAAKDLDEAIALDVAVWNPFGSDISLLSFYERVENHWRVAVWVWPKQEENRLLQRIDDGVQCTHIMPVMAWYIASVQEKSDVLLVNMLESDKRRIYALVSPAGVPKVLSQITGEHEARRFWRSLGDRQALIGQCFLCGESESGWLSDVVSMRKLKPELPRVALLNRASLKGLEDWSDPLYWRKPILAILSLILVWMVTDAAVIAHRTEKVHTMLSHAERQALDVLKYRDQVDSMQSRLQKYASLRVLQHEPGWLLGALNKAIPEDIWLNVLQSGQGWVDIHGQGKDVVRLIVLLEGIDGIEKVTMLSDIRPDARTGLESFQLRLILEREQLEGAA